MEKLSLSSEQLIKVVRRALDASCNGVYDFVTPPTYLVKFYAGDQKRFLELPVHTINKCIASRKIGEACRVMLEYGRSDTTFFYRFSILRQPKKPTESPHHLFSVTFLYTRQYGTEREIEIKVGGKNPPAELDEITKVFRRFYALISDIEKES